MPLPLPCLPCPTLFPQGVAAVSHATIRPINPKHFEKVDPAPIEVDSFLHSPVGAAGGAAFMPSMASHMIPASVLPNRQH